MDAFAPGVGGCVLADLTALTPAARQRGDRPTSHMNCKLKEGKAQKIPLVNQTSEGEATVDALSQALVLEIGYFYVVGPNQ